MKTTKIIFFLVNAIILAILVHLATQPGGRLIPLAIFCFIMSVVCFYYGFISKDDHILYFWKYRTQAAAVIFFILSLGIATWAKQERSGIEVISEWITPYPEVSKMMLVPRVSKEYIWGWLLESPDSPEKVIDFYMDDKNTQGWDVSRTKSMLFLKKKGFKMVLMITPKPGGAGLYYQLKQDQYSDK